MSAVNAQLCEGYELNTVRSSVRRAIDGLGGMARFVRPGERVFLKANLLMRRRPELATTTHPSIVQAVAELVCEAGGHPIIGDSPGGYNDYTRESLEAIYETCGMAEAARLSGAELNYETESVTVDFPAGRMINNFRVMRPITCVDRVINIPKMKTHMTMVLSGAVKNLYGVIPGGFKSDYHLQFPRINDFAGLLVDICEFVRPALSVMDAVVAMEGHGPTAGRPRKCGLVLAGDDPYAVDLAAAGLIGLEPSQIPAMADAVRRGLSGPDLSSVRLSGVPLDDVRVNGFKIPMNGLPAGPSRAFMASMANRLVNLILHPRPVFDAASCRRCGVCVRSCPPQAIRMTGGYPAVDLRKCIRCFCCQELCHYEAIRVFAPMPRLFRLFLR